MKHLYLYYSGELRFIYSILMRRESELVRVGESGNVSRGLHVWRTDRQHEHEYYLCKKPCDRERNQ